MRSTSPAGSTPRTRRLPLSKRLIKLVGRMTFWWMSRAAGLLRPWSVDLLGRALGSMFYTLSRRYRTVALKNLREAYSGRLRQLRSPKQDEMTEAEIVSITKQSFRHFAREALQFFYLLSLKREQVDALIDLEGREHLDAALQDGRGCIIITAHYGNWELLARKLVISGYAVNVIARDSDDPGITGLATRIRESGGYRVFDRDQPILGAFRSLKNNEILGILPDQNESGGMLVDFFSRPAATATGPAVLSLKSGAPIVPVFAPRLADGRYQATAYPRIEFQPSGDHGKDVRDLTALINQAIEREVRSNPSQWLWLHDRWKLSPGASAAGYRSNGKQI